MIVPVYAADLSVERRDAPALVTWPEHSFTPFTASAVSRSGLWFLVTTPRPVLSVVAPVGSRLVPTLTGGLRLSVYAFPPGFDATAVVRLARQNRHGLRLASPAPAPAVEPVKAAGPVAGIVEPLARDGDADPITLARPGWYRQRGGYFRKRDLLPERWAALRPLMVGVWPGDEAEAASVAGPAGQLGFAFAG